MSLLKSKKALFFSTLVIILMGIYFAVTLRSPKVTNQKPIETSQNQKINPSIEVDLDGDGVKETLKIITSENGQTVLEAYNKQGEKIAAVPQEKPIPEPFSYKAIKLNLNSNKEYIQWNRTAGAHQMETVFLTMNTGEILPIYGIDEIKNTAYLPFYTSRGDIVVGDLNDDGKMEVIEFAEEYPPDSPRLVDPEAEKKTMEVFGDNGEDAIKVFTRENYGKGRGRKVIWSIYSFTDVKETPIFVKLQGNDFETLADKLVAAANEVEKDTFMKYTDLTQDSIDFNIFVRKFWNQGAEYEFPLN